jgi:hypothetical protein
MRIGPEEDACGVASVSRAVAAEAESANQIAPIRAFCASHDPSTRQEMRPVHKFFSCRRRRRAAVQQRLKSCAKIARRNCARRADLEISKQRKPRFIGTSLQRENRARNFASKESVSV